MKKCLISWSCIMLFILAGWISPARVCAEPHETVFKLPFFYTGSTTSFCIISNTHTTESVDLAFKVTASSGDVSDNAFSLGSIGPRKTVVLQIGGVTTGAEDYISAVSGAAPTNFPSGSGVSLEIGAGKFSAGRFILSGNSSVFVASDPICGYLTAICYQTDPSTGGKRALPLYRSRADGCDYYY